MIRTITVIAALGIFPLAASAQVAPMVLDVDLGDVELATINHVFTTSAGEGPFIWSSLTNTVGSPAVAATLTTEGNFNWFTAGSARPSPYAWEVTVHNVRGQSDTGILRLNLIIPVPEPSAILFGLTIAALIGIGFVKRFFAPRRSPN